MNDIVKPEIVEISSTDESCEIKMQLPPELLYFQGHFPDTPILPGVVQLDWAVKLAKRHLNYPDNSDVEKLEVLKFQHILVPDQTVTLSLSRKNEKKFLFSYMSGDKKHSSGRVVLKEK